MTDNARNDAPAVTEKKSSRRSFRRKKPWHQGRGGSTQNGQSNKQGKPQPKIFFCGDPHGEFDYINKTVEKYRPDAIVILGDLQPPDDLETLLAPTLAITQVWWIPGNHDTDCEEYYDRLWHGPIAEHNLHGRVAEVAGLRIAGLGGVFRGQIWMPEGRPNYQQPGLYAAAPRRICGEAVCRVVIVPRSFLLLMKLCNSARLTFWSRMKRRAATRRGLMRSIVLPSVLV